MPSPDRNSNFNHGDAKSNPLSGSEITSPSDMVNEVLADMAKTLSDKLVKLHYSILIKVFCVTSFKDKEDYFILTPRWDTNGRRLHNSDPEPGYALGIALRGLGFYYINEPKKLFSIPLLSLSTLQLMTNGIRALPIKSFSKDCKQHSLYMVKAGINFEDVENGLSEYARVRRERFKEKFERFAHKLPPREEMEGNSGM